MLRRKIGLSSLSGSNYRKMFFKDFSGRTRKPIIHSFRSTMKFIFLFIIFGILVLFFFGGNSYLQIIIGYSITGFFTFFMGYLGWVLAQAVIETMTGGDKRVENGVIYYFRKLRRDK